MTMFADEHVGMWSTADGAVRKLLLPNGRYLAMIAHGEIRHQGEYRIVGTRIEYFDDEGKTGVGVFEDGMMIGASGVPLYPKDALADDADMSAVLAVSSWVGVVTLPAEIHDCHPRAGGDPNIRLLKVRVGSPPARG